MPPVNPPTRRGAGLCVTTRERGPWVRGANRGNRADWANPPPSDPVPARQVTFQVTYGVGWGANRANRGVGWRNRALRESGQASQPCDWPRLATVAVAASL